MEWEWDFYILQSYGVFCTGYILGIQLVIFLLPFESSTLLDVTSVGLASISWFTTERKAVFCALFVFVLLLIPNHLSILPYRVSRLWRLRLLLNIENLNEIRFQL